MPTEAHKAAAVLHDNAAASHRTAAEQCAKGDHSACHYNSTAALDHSTKAHAATVIANQKSAQHAKPVVATAAH